MNSNKFETEIITGDFMNLKYLGNTSIKYKTVTIDLIDNTEKNFGKVMIVHQYVKMAGVLFIQEVLKKNGFIDEFSNPVNSTLCSVCGISVAILAGA